MKAPIREAAILAAIQKWLTAKGIFHWRNSVGAACIAGRWQRFGLPGSSDLLGILPSGQFLAIECKAENGRLSPEQKTFLDTIRANNGVAIIAKNVDDVAAILGEQQLLFTGRETAKGESDERRDDDERNEA